MYLLTFLQIQKLIFVISPRIFVVVVKLFWWFYRKNILKFLIEITSYFVFCHC